MQVNNFIIRLRSFPFFVHPLLKKYTCVANAVYILMGGIPIKVEGCHVVIIVMVLVACFSFPGFEI